MNDPSAGPGPLLDGGARAALLARFGRLTLAELRALDAAVGELAAEKRYHGKVDRGFQLAWYDGPDLVAAERAELDVLFSDVMIALARGVSGVDVTASDMIPPSRGAGPLAGMAAFFLAPSRTRQLQDAAIGLIEGAARPADLRRGTIACWNVACAAVLRGHLHPEVVATLEVAWRRALGDPPA